MASQVQDGRFVAYIVDDDCYDYYVVKQDGTPWKAEKYEVIRLGEQEYEVHKGEIILKGVWLDKIPSTKKWWIMTKHPCIFRIHDFVDSQLELHEQSTENALRKNLHQDMVCHADEHGAWIISKEDHYFMLEESRRREEFYFDQIFEDENQEENGDDSGDN